MTTASQTSAPAAACPPWCVIHDGLKGPVGHEGAPIEISTYVSVGVRQVKGQHAEPVPTINADNGFVTEAEARGLALALLSLADRLGRDRVASVQ